MHAAPPVRISLGRSHGWIAFVAFAAGAGAANLGAWWRMGAGAPTLLWGAAAAGSLGALAAGAWAWRNQVPSALNWDGTGWQWAGHDGDAQVAIDLNAWMLVRFSAPGRGRCWIAASRRASGGGWLALRAALYSRRPAGPPIDAPPA